VISSVHSAICRWSSVFRDDQRLAVASAGGIWLCRNFLSI
jgi:hypothetical protein